MALLFQSLLCLLSTTFRTSQSIETTANPTTWPTYDPTAIPSENPIDAPTNAPTTNNPTSSPTTPYPTTDPTSSDSNDDSEGMSLSETLLSINGFCEDSGNILHVDWDELILDDSLAPDVNISLSVDPDTLSLRVEVDTEYVGFAVADHSIPGFGASFIIDFVESDAASMDIRRAGSCSNRDAADFETADWIDIWRYSSRMNTPADLGSDFLAYPPSTKWTLNQSAVGQCTGVRWTAHFSWYDLLQCTEYDDDQRLVVISETAEWVNMSGVVLVNLVSPLVLNTDSGYYRVYQLASAPFMITVHKTVNTLSETGIDLFMVSLIAVFKETAFSQWTLMVLSESADFLALSAPCGVLSAPCSLEFKNDGNDVTEGCLTSGSLCLQLWEMGPPNGTTLECPTTFDGDYTFQWSVICNHDANDYDNAPLSCTNYVAEFGNGPIALSAPLQWTDDLCLPEVFQIRFEAEVIFYRDIAFGNVLEADDQYALGDVAYIEVVVGDPALFMMSNVSLDNVWICTTHPDNEPLTVTQDLGTGGCLVSGLDEPFPKHIVRNQVPDSSVVKGNVTLYRPFTNNTIRFSFPIEYSVERTNLYVHVQSTIDITPGTQANGRRLLQDEGDETASNTRHFVGSVGITDSPLDHPAVNGNGNGNENERDDSLPAEQEKDIDSADDIKRVGDGDTMPIIIAVAVTSAVWGFCCVVMAIGYRCSIPKDSKKLYL